MPERSWVTQGVQLGVEATPGTSVAANKKLTTVRISPGIQFNSEEVDPAGYKFITDIVPGQEWTEYEISGRSLSFTDIVYLLSSLLRTVTPTTPPTPANATARTWTFTPQPATDDTNTTFTIEQGSAVRAHKATYFMVNELGLRFNRQRIELTGRGMGPQLQDNIALTAAPTVVLPVKALPKKVDIWIDPTSAGLGTTKMLGVLEASFNVAGRYNPVWTLDSTKESYSGHVEGAARAELRLLFKANSEGMAHLQKMRDGTVQYLRLKVTGPNIEAGNDYYFQVDMAGKIRVPDRFEESNGLIAVPWTFSSVYDSAFGAAPGKAFTVEVQNALNAL